MARARLRRSPIVVLVACAGFAFGVPPTAAETLPPSPAHTSRPVDLGILAERRMTESGLGLGSNSVRSGQPFVPCTAAWRVVDSQSGAWNNALGGISAISATDMWAVGNAQDAASGNDVNLAERWDGTAWSTVPVPNPANASNDLNDVFAIAPTDVWAVGVSSTNVTSAGTTYHWNGTTWTYMAPAPGGSLNDVFAVGPSDVWAVGESLSPSNILVTQIQHWTGGPWTQTPSPVVGAGDNVLFGVSASASGDVWAVGYSRATNSSPRQSLIEHWNGSVWSVDSSPTVSTGTLVSVAAATGSDARAVGYANGSNGLPIGIGLNFNGSTWSSVGVSEPSVYGEKIGDVVWSSPNYWAVGYHLGNGNGPGPHQPFALESNGTNWMTFPVLATNGNGPNDTFAVSVPPAGDVWAVGRYRTPTNLDKNLVLNYSDLAAPTGITAAPLDQAAQVSWTPPCASASVITSYKMTAYDGCSIQGSVLISPSATTAPFNGLTNGVAYTFKLAAVNAFGVGPQSGASNVVTPTGLTKPTWVSACSARQYTLTGSDGSSWTDMDAVNLGVTFTPPVDSFAILTGNVDLWTANAGFNQDIGIAVVGGGVYPTVAGQPETWKESGGFAGTFSPNAATVQAVIPVLASSSYTAKLRWKTNLPDGGTIVAGAGPAGGFSPTRLTVHLVPASPITVFKKVSTAQYGLTGSDGVAWPAIDSTNLTLQFTPPAGGWIALISGSVDLWTANAGFNQDIGIGFSGGTILPGVQPAAWKESGGFAGTFSPNAAYVQVTEPVVGGTPYSADLRWKANQRDSGSIFAGAGPIGGKFSPTSLTVLLIASAAQIHANSSSSQYTQVDSDGEYWQSMDTSQLVYGPFINGPADWMLSVNVDLWTVVAGYNQDIGIVVSGGTYGPSTLVAWKESGGFAGTFSPNAAFVSAVLHVDTSMTYTISVVWKANRLATAANQIVAGAGPIGGNYSPTTLILVQLS